MKSFFACFILLVLATFVFSQNEQSPLVEKEIQYKNWKYKDSRTGKDIDLRNYVKGKKLVAVVYYAPWCPNWRHDAPMVERLYEKYKDKGFGVIGVSEYDTVDAAKANLDSLKITFPSVAESTDRGDKQKTPHYEYRKSTGDTRGWGSPWYIFLMPSAIEKKGDTLTKKTFVINGEMIAGEGEKFIREKLGLPEMETKPASAMSITGKVEPCQESKPAELVAPTAKSQ
jgi:thiol-disulfide isomerase/thioredoxin